MELYINNSLKFHFFKAKVNADRWAGLQTVLLLGLLWFDVESSTLV